jgi:hypothetical protein
MSGDIHDRLRESEPTSLGLLPDGSPHLEGPEICLEAVWSTGIGDGAQHFSNNHPLENRADGAWENAVIFWRTPCNDRITTWTKELKRQLPLP